jgi:hypothetical protein
MNTVIAMDRIATKRAPHDRSGGVHTLLPVAVTTVVAVLAVLTFEAYSGVLGIIGPPFEIVQNGEVHIIKVPPGGNLQAAINNANSGDVVELTAGAVYTGEIKLPNRPLTDYVTIRTSSISDLPAGKRVGPAQASSMATITAPAGRSAVKAANGAHHYRFIGIRFTPSGSAYNYGLLAFGGEERRPELVPHHLEIDRSYIHPYEAGVVRRGIALNSADTVIKNSYIAGFGFKGEETQGICGWTGTRNVKIVNNYIEGGAENILFGGADPANADLIPSGIEVRGNHLTKPAAWAKTATVKTLLQLKNARHVQIVGNTLTNNWEGSAIRITVRNQDGGAPFSTIEDVLIKDNVIAGSGDGINILGKDDTYPSQTLKQLKIVNNLFLDLGTEGYDGAGYFVQVADGEDIIITNNTVFNRGNIATFHGTVPSNFVFRENIVGHGSYGIHGLSDIRSELARQFFQNNIFVDNLGVEKDATSFPPGNIFLTNFREVGFANMSKRDFSLSVSSRYTSAGAGRNSIGCDTRTLPPLPN